MTKQEFLKCIEAGNPPTHLGVVDRQAHLRTCLAFSELAACVYDDVPDNIDRECALKHIIVARNFSLAAITGPKPQEPKVEGKAVQGNGAENPDNSSEHDSGIKKAAPKKRGRKPRSVPRKNGDVLG